ncbi:DUF3483 domain-containing protein [Gluconacetobacter asukensis]|uniref:DUF3483 domain-containing protein n=1 Tax=Gluconacetobacter asukensis TaxID=1017181 RepID=A0A7W4IYW4_9PROT|nr:DUF3483 domain-containing protein [Gluconacetobacter asukensis]MBB2171428.1 DUF3483 domain-containing protein [Gluconacetobacter asukensis]
MRALIAGEIGGIALAAVVGWLVLLARWLKGRPAAGWLAGLRHVPRRYLVDVHHVVARRPAAARMHAMAAGGVLGGSALALLAVLLGAGGIVWALAALVFGMGGIGALLVWRRRVPKMPPALSGGAFLWLPAALAAWCVGNGLAALFMAIGAPALPVILSVVLGGLGGVALLRLVALGPMRHALAGVAWLAGHTRPGRFSGKGRDTGLRPLDLAAPRLGVLVPADFSGPELAAFDACIQCGRCEEACPAFAAGQRLNPKALIQTLSGAMRAVPPPYAGRPAPSVPMLQGKGGMGQPIVGNVLHRDMLWACTTCRACVEECPMLIEHVDAVVALRRGQTLMLGATRDGAAQALRASRERAEPGGRDLAARGDMIAALDVPVLPPGGETDILLWLGEGAFDARYGRTLRALVTLMRRAGLRFATLGADEVDCGDLARRLGDEATFQSLAAEAISALKARCFTKIVTADPHVLHVLRNEYPALGGRWEVQHHTGLLDELVRDGRLRLERREGARVAYHDPCYLGRYNGEIDAPRRLLDAACTDRVEMARHGMRAMCCGGGGGSPVSDVDAVTRIPDLRMEQARAAGASLVAVACPGCTAMLEGVTGPRPEIRDVAELVLAAVVA